MLWIGVDAGATKTESAAFGADRERLSRAFEGPGNLVTDRDTAEGHILRAVQAVIPPGLLPEPAFICVGAAGADTGGNAEALHTCLSRAIPGAQIRVMSDARLALYAAHEGGDGMILIAGTGSIALARHGAAFRRAGGWGQLLGDEGSGYDIVRRAFLRLLEQYEADGGYDALSRLILERIGRDVFGAVQFFHDASKGEIAALLPLVLSCADGGDEAAAELLREAGRALAGLAARLYRYAGFSRRVSVRCIGGVFGGVTSVYQAFSAYLGELEPRAAADAAPVYVPAGALYAYAESS
jgi:N-acetylglucosamine kinase-like BadF-type ATPase